MNPLGRLQLNDCKFTWQLENFSKLGKSGVVDQISSSYFLLTDDSNEFQWRLDLRPFSESDQRFVASYLTHGSTKELEVYFELILADSNGVEITNARGIRKFSIRENRWSWGCDKLIEREVLLKNLIDDKLNIICKIHTDVYSEEEVNIDKKILDNYELLLFNGNTSDLTITVDNKHIKAHKNILSARSKVFAAMFNHDMKENNTDSVKITDVRYDVMQELLLFIYSGKVKALKRNAKDLLAAADKYEIIDLAVLCEKNLWKGIKIENACDILVTADFYNRKKLRDQVFAYIMDNIKEVKNTTTFKSLNKSYPELFEEIIFKVLEAKI